jgi:hypothetical protein
MYSKSSPRSQLAPGIAKSSWPVVVSLRTSSGSKKSAPATNPAGDDQQTWILEFMALVAITT